MNVGGPLRPIHVPIERAGWHPLLRHAVIEKNPNGGRYVTWPRFTERQVRVAHDIVRLIYVDMLDNPDLVVTPTDQITADTWEQIWVGQ